MDIGIKRTAYPFTVYPLWLWTPWLDKKWLEEEATASEEKAEPTPIRKKKAPAEEGV